MFFISAKDPTLPTFDVNNDFSLSNEKKIVFFMIILACNVFFILFWASEFVDAWKSLIKKRYPRLYAVREQILTGILAAVRVEESKSTAF